MVRLMNWRGIAIGAFFSVGSLLGALTPLEDLVGDLPQEVRDGLAETGEVFRYDRSYSGLKLVPSSPSASIVGVQQRDLEPDAMVEGLYLIPYPEGHEGLDLDIYNLTRRVSAISDVVYHSARRDAFVPLFDDVYRIEDLRRKRRLEDPFVESIPAYESILMHMDEVNLGSAYYEAQYVYNGDSLGFFVKNVTSLRMFLKVVDSENMRINLLMFPTDRGFLVYGYCAVKLASRNLVFSMMDPFSGFYKRLYAIETWLYNSLHGESRRPEVGDELDF